MAHKDHHYQRLHETLRSHSYKDVLKALTEIRTLLQDNKSHVKVATRLRATGITKILIKIIHKKYSKLLCLAMSVLSTCSLELETRILLHRNRVPLLLMKIKDEFTSESILSRICRFIGNLGALPAAAIEFHDFEAVPFLVKVIKISDNNKSSSETIQMAMRALRVLGDTREHRADMIKEDVVKNIAEHLKSEDDQLLKCTLKTLTSFCSSTDGALQVMSSNSGQGFENLVKLAKGGPRSELALSCICHLANVEAVRPDLGKVGAISVIFEELKKSNCKTEPRALVTAIERFCCECVNRIRIKENNHFPDMLDLFRSTKFSYLHDILLCAMSRYLHDEKCLGLMVDNGLIKALICKLRQYIRTLIPAAHSFQPNRKLSLDNSDSDVDLSSPSSPTRSPSPQMSPAYVGSSSPSSSCMSMSPPRSPSEPSISSWSPNYSPCSSSATEAYSPVYDESSDDDEDECLALLGSDDEESATSSEKGKIETKNPYVSNLFLLIVRISMYDWAVTELITARCINTMIAYLIVGDMYAQQVATILCNTMKKHEFLLPLIRHRYAILIYNKLGIWKHNGECKICRAREATAKRVFSEMVTMTNTPCTRGELSYMLQKGSEKDKISAALSIPYIIRSVGHYRELLLSKDQSCLSLILDLVENETESSAAIQAISVLSRSFQIAFTTPIPSKVPLFENYVPVAVESSNVVTFSLDDQSLVRADKCALSDASEVFSSMLYGSFKESKEEVVRLKDVSRASLILFLVHCKSYVGDHELSIGKPDVVDVLELLLISDRYLISDLNVKLKDFIKLKYFNAESLAPLIKWCHLKLDLNCGTEVEELYGDACAFLLSGQIQQQQRVLIFKSIIKERTVWERLKACIFATISHKLQKEFPQFSTFLQFHFN